MLSGMIAVSCRAAPFNLPPSRRRLVSALPGNHRTAHPAGSVAGVCRSFGRAESPAVLRLYPPGVGAGGMAEDPRGRRSEVRRATQLFNRYALPLEQPDLLPGAKGVAAGGSIVPNNPVAGDEERDGIVRHHRAHGAGGFRRAGLARYPGVGPDLTARDPPYHLKHPSLEGRRPREVCRDLDLLTGDGRSDSLSHPACRLVGAPRKEASNALPVAFRELLGRGGSAEKAHTALAHPDVDLTQRRVAREEAVGPARQHALYQLAPVFPGRKVQGC